MDYILDDSEDYIAVAKGSGTCKKQENSEDCSYEMDATVSLRKFTADSNEFMYIKITTRQVQGSKKLVPLLDGQML